MPTSGSLLEQAVSDLADTTGPAGGHISAAAAADPDSATARDGFGNRAWDAANHNDPCDDYNYE